MNELSPRHRGCSLPLPRVVTDLEADLPFAPATGKLQEHYGVVLGLSTIRQRRSSGDHLRLDRTR